MYNDNFIIRQNPFVTGVKGVIDVLIGIVCILLFIKFLFFICSYIYKTFRLIFSSIMNSFKIDFEKNNASKYRKTLYKDSKDSKDSKDNKDNKELFNETVKNMNKKY